MYLLIQERLNQAFVCSLKGDTFDGHDFINTAIEKGATGAIVEKGRAVEGIVCIEVENTFGSISKLSTLPSSPFRYSRSGYYWFLW